MSADQQVMDYLCMPGFFGISVLSVRGTVLSVYTSGRGSMGVIGVSGRIVAVIISMTEQCCAWTVSLTGRKRSGTVTNVEEATVSMCMMAKSVILATGRRLMSVCITFAMPVCVTCVTLRERSINGGCVGGVEKGTVFTIAISQPPENLN